MISAAEGTTLEPFFLTGQTGRLFALRIAPASGRAAGRAAIFFPPFAEEMNKARRCVAQQARALAAAGVIVLLVDPFGTGDSEGDFADARWTTWREDALRCIEWLGEHGATRIILWGLRLGAVLAVETAPASALPVERLLLWQPVSSGSVMANQFLRLRVAAEMTQAGGGTSVQNLRASAEREGWVEIAGYRVTRELLDELDGLDMARLTPGPRATVDWIEVVAGSGRAPGAAGRKVLDRWRSDGAKTKLHVVVGEPFWSTVEICVPGALIEATRDIILNPA